jgi:hypothetical protein
MRCHMMCVWPAIRSGPYTQVARPSPLLGYFEDAARPLHAFYLQTRAEGLARTQIRDQVSDRFEKPILLQVRELGKLAEEQRTLII